MIKRTLIIFCLWTISLGTVINTEHTTHINTIKLPKNMLCPQWAQMTIDVGWPETDLAQIDKIMHRESRCFSNSHYAKDPMGGSYGLMQINAFWCKPSKYYPTGYLQSFGILTNCKQLFHPRTNLIAARTIWQYSFAQYGDGWLPWQQ